jgi:hypothetical protein
VGRLGAGPRPPAEDACPVVTAAESPGTVTAAGWAGTRAVSAGTGATPRPESRIRRSSMCRYYRPFEFAE